MVGGAPIARDGRLVATLAAGRPADVFAFWIAAGPAYVALGSGVFLLDPATALPFAIGGLDATGAALVQVPVPESAELLSAVLHFQAVSLQLSPPALAFSAASARRVE